MRPDTEATMIAIYPDALKALTDSIAELHRKVDASIISPPPKWITINDYAKKVGKTPGTVRLWIRQGKVECEGRLIANPDA